MKKSMEYFGFCGDVQARQGRSLKNGKGGSKFSFKGTYSRQCPGVSRTAVYDKIRCNAHAKWVTKEMLQHHLSWFGSHTKREHSGGIVHQGFNPLNSRFSGSELIPTRI